MLGEIFLILFLLNPTTGGYQETISKFNTMQECQKFRKETLQGMKPRPGIYYILTCEKSKPTFTVEG